MGYFLLSTTRDPVGLTSTRLETDRYDEAWADWEELVDEY